MCQPSRRLTARLSILSFLLAGWLVDVTGSYTATFFLSGGAMLASALTLAVILGIRHCRRAGLAKEAPPPILSKQTDSSIAVDGGGQLSSHFSASEETN